MSNLHPALQPTLASPAAEQFDRRYRQFYTAEAPGYDQIRFSDPDGVAFNTSEQGRICELLDLAPGQTVLDVAAGTGRIAAALAARGLDVVAYDITPNMLRQAQARAAARELENLRCVSGNGRMLPFVDGQFDAVISIRFLHLFPATFYRSFIQEMWRVVRPGGLLLIQFDSAMAGGGAVWLRELYRRLVLGHKPRYFLRPDHIPNAFGAIDNLSLHGFSPFGERLMRRLHPRGAARVDALLSEGRPSFLANHIFVRAIKR